jgi:hypothetical protein
MTTKPLKVGDSVTSPGSPVVYVVTSANTERNTVDVKATRDGVVLQKDVPWATVFLLDECQNGLRIVTKGTDEHRRVATAPR